MTITDKATYHSPAAALKLLVVLGEGGHTTELLRLVDLLGEHYAYSYVVAAEDTLSVSQIRRPGPVYRLPRPRGKTMSLGRATVRMLGSSWQTLRLLWQLRPTAILSTGPALAVPIALLGKTLGACLIFVETGSRVKKLSLTGRILYPVADLFFVQWPQLQAKLPRAIYAGRLL